MGAVEELESSRTHMSPTCSLVLEVSAPASINNFGGDCSEWRHSAQGLYVLGPPHSLPKLGWLHSQTWLSSLQLVLWIGVGNDACAQLATRYTYLG